MTKRLYEITTTEPMTFYVVAEDPTTAENTVQEWISKRDWRRQSVNNIRVIAEADEYTKFGVLITEAKPDERTKENILRRLKGHEDVITIINGVETRFTMRSGYVLATSTESIRKWQKSIDAEVPPVGTMMNIDDAISTIYNTTSSLDFIDTDPEV